MISAIAVVLGGDDEAIRIARKVNSFVMWFSPLEVRRHLRAVDELMDVFVLSLRRAA
jgi:hypothetical protein